MVGVSVNLAGVRQKISEQAIDRGRYALANQMLDDMTPFVPKDEGTLRTTGHASGDNKQLIWKTPYARKMYYEQFGNYTTPGTGPRWDLKAKGMFMSDWVKVILAGMGVDN